MAAHDRYFSGLAEALARAGIWRPTLLIDKTRMDHNLQLISRQLPSHLSLRIVDKSLACLPLLEYVMQAVGSRKIMSFHLPVTLQVLDRWPDADILYGKPMPANALRQLQQTCPDSVFRRLLQQTTWLIDSGERLGQYHGLAESFGCDLAFAFEVDVGLHRGGFVSPDALAQAVSQLAGYARLQCRGLMAYDAQVAEIPAVFGGPAKELRNSQQKLSAFQNCLPETSREIINTGGSKTILSYSADTPANEISVGSAFLQPTDFDLPALTALKPALYLATPVLKTVNATLPGPSWLTHLLQQFRVFPRQGCFIYGGKWMAEPVSPVGLKTNSLWGESSNQQFMALPDNHTVQPDDMVFLRPTQSEAVLQYFGDIAICQNNTIVEYWPVLPTV
ncbi:alanine racemase [Gynuella sunshinyii]|uniref:Putative amino acid aldolase or racemase n=1 Tax=Gynuella sunshinyii YC6258 TaxID=1445510 RepID=A0A0C5VF26_9GAMM|nr:alanine racemase [Gynuella sunshinyii]AJQ92741.1 putative amino acid aldolase or racemase [Gynuella sunshinyii YC6258]